LVTKLGANYERMYEFQALAATPAPPPAAGILVQVM